MRKTLAFMSLAVAAGVMLMASTSARAQTVTFLGTEDLTTSLSLLGSSYTNVRALAGQYYAAADDGLHGSEPWVSDGTPDGTYMLGDLIPGSGSSSPSNFKFWNGSVFFGTASPVDGCALWKTDGTEAGTVKVKDIPGRIRVVQFRESGDVLYFMTTGTDPFISLWRTDGTEPGTFQLKTPENFQINSPTHGAVSGGLVFMGWDLDLGLGTELYFAGNTSDSVSLVKDINPGSGGSFVNLPYAITMAGEAYFVADDGVHGGELWKSDGTAEGTAMVKDALPGSASGFMGMLGNFITDKWIEEAPLYLGGSGVFGVWKTDGTEAGTVQITNADASSALGNFVKLNGNVVFAADGAGAGMEIWGSDGTPAGTQMLKDINPDPGTSSSLGMLTVAGDFVYFRADDGTHGMELWRTDGTPEGTLLVRDIHPGPGASMLTDFVAAGDYLVFTADDGVHGEEVWIAGPNVVGAKLVVDLEPGAAGSDPKQLESLGSKVVFHATTTEHGPELWAVSVGSGVAAAGDWQLFE